MNKPDWKDAPKWANYLAMDADGAWHWYEGKPTKNEFFDVWETSCGEAMEAVHPADVWNNSLEARPE